MADADLCLVCAKNLPVTKSIMYMERVGRKRLYYCSYSCFKLRLYLKVSNEQIENENFVGICNFVSALAGV